MEAQLNVTEFREKTAKGVSLVDFWAAWCGPCRMLMPVIEQLESEFAGKAQILKLDVDKNKELAKEFNVRNIPVLFLIKDGEVVQQFNGPQNKNKLADALNAALQ